MLNRSKKPDKQESRKKYHKSQQKQIIGMYEKINTTQYKSGARNIDITGTAQCTTRRLWAVMFITVFTTVRQ
jgi:hypothetical protein